MSINDFDVIDLLGLSSLSDEEKQPLRNEINQMIITDFFLHELDEVLEDTEKDQITTMLEQGKEFDEIVAFITTKVPNFTVELVKFLSEAKKSLVAKQYENRIKQISEDITNLQDPDNSELQKRLKQYMSAQNLLQNDQYDQIPPLFQ